MADYNKLEDDKYRFLKEELKQYRERFRTAKTSFIISHSDGDLDMVYSAVDILCSDIYHLAKEKNFQKDISNIKKSLKIYDNLKSNSIKKNEDGSRTLNLSDKNKTIALKNFSYAYQKLVYIMTKLELL